LNNQLAKYLIGDANITRADCLISREQINDKLDYVYVEGYDSGIQFYQGVQKRKPFRRKSDGQIEEVDEPLVEEKKSKPKNRGTGGKLSYAKVYISRLVELRKKGLNPELIGICLCLTSCIEWETGFLTVGRGKRRRYMSKEDMAKELKVSISTTKRFIKKLSELGILEIKDKRFKLNTRFIAKGRAFDAN